MLNLYIDIYLNLDESEEEAFREELGTIESDEREQVMEIVTSWLSNLSASRRN